jgi:hypothetical protein
VNGEHEKAKVPSIGSQLAACVTSSTQSSSATDAKAAVTAVSTAVTATAAVAAAPSVAAMSTALSVGNMSLQDTFDLVRQRIEMMVW